MGSGGKGGEGKKGGGQGERNLEDGGTEEGAVAVGFGLVRWEGKGGGETGRT